MRALTLVATLLAAVATASCGGGGDGDATPAPSPAATRSGTTSPGEWAMLGHDLASWFYNPDETAISPETVPSLTEAWTLRATVNGTPAVVDGTVYVLSVTGLYALDAETGAELWSDGRISGTSSPSYANGRVFALDSGAILYAFDADAGTELWHAAVEDHAYAAGFSSPIPANGLVIAGSSSREESSSGDELTFRGGVVAFDAESGAEVWRHDTVEPPYNGVSVWSSVTVDTEAGLVFGSTGNNYTGEASDTSDSIFALDLETGDLVWNTQLSEGDVFTIPNPQSEDTDFGTNPILFEAEIGGETRALLGAGQKSGVFWALDRETGEVVWSTAVSPRGSPLIGGILNNGAFDGERIIVAGNNASSDAPGGEPASGESEPLGAATVPTSVLQALDPATGDVLWERQLPAWVWAPITLANGVGFVSAENELQAFDTSTGEKLFSLKTEGTISSGAAIAGGRVYFGSGLSYFFTTPGNTFRALALP